MNTKGFTDNNTNIETPNDIGVAEKPLSDQLLLEGWILTFLSQNSKRVKIKNSKRILLFYLP